MASPQSPVADQPASSGPRVADGPVAPLETPANSSEPTRIPGVIRAKQRESSPSNIDDILYAGLDDPRAPVAAKPIPPGAQPGTERGPDGRFVKPVADNQAPASPVADPSSPVSPAHSEADGVKTPKAADAPAGERVLPERFEDIGKAPEQVTGDEPAPFDYSGITFADPAAEQRLKSTVGRVKGYERRINTLQREQQDLAHAIRVRDEALEEWDTWAKGPSAPGKPAAAAQPASQPANKGFKDTLDTQYLRDLAETKGIDAALSHMAEGFDSYAKGLVSNAISQVKNELSGTLDQRLKPVETAQQVREVHGEVMNLFRNVSSAVDNVGNSRYPELLSNDREVVGRIVQIWKQFPEEFAMSERGVHTAVLQYRYETGGAPRSQSAPAPTSSTGSPGRSVPTPPSHFSANGEEPLDGNAVSSGVRQPQDPAQDGVRSGDQIVKEIMDVKVNLTSPDGHDLGFSRRRRPF